MFRFLIGLFCGIAAGMVLAPASGDETRRQLRQKAEEFRHETIDKGRDTARDVGSAVAERLYNRAVGQDRP